MFYGNFVFKLSTSIISAVIFPEFRSMGDKLSEIFTVDYIQITCSDGV